MVRPLLGSLFLAVALGACGSSSPDVCGQPVACGGGSVQTCASANHSRCSFHRSDGETVSCASCADCSEAQRQVTSWCAGDTGGSGASGPGGTGGGGASTGVQSAACKTYLACAAATVPSTFPQLVPVYGPSGSCWSSDAALAASCTQACQKSLDNLAMSFAAPECHPGAPVVDMATPPPDMAQACLPQNAPCTNLTQCCSAFCVVQVCL